MILDMIYTWIISLLEKFLLGMFALVEIIYSGDSEKIFALIIVALMAISSTLLFTIVVKCFKADKKPKRKIKRKTKNRNKAKRSSNKKATGSKVSNNKQNSVKTNRIKNNVTRIDVKREIVTPGVKTKKRKS